MRQQNKATNMIHLKFAGDLVSDYRIFIDLGPFFQKVNGRSSGVVL